MVHVFEGQGVIGYLEAEVAFASLEVSLEIEEFLQLELAQDVLVTHAAVVSHEFLGAQTQLQLGCF